MEKKRYVKVFLDELANENHKFNEEIDFDLLENVVAGSNEFMTQKLQEVKEVFGDNSTQDIAVYNSNRLDFI